jgi:heat shock protein HslJ
MTTTPAPFRARPLLWRVVPGAALLAVALLAGCGGDVAGTDGVTDPPSGDHRLLEGHGPDGEIPLVDDAPVTLSIDGDDWGGTAACNHYGGTVEVDGDRLEVRELFQTEMGCLGDGVMEVERRYLDAFARVAQYERDGARLVLRGPDTQLVFEQLAPEADAALVGTTWVLSSLVEGTGDDGAVSSVAGAPTLRFTDDGDVAGDTGCNTFGATYTLDGATVVISGLSVSDASCPDEIVAGQEAHVLGVLASSGVTVDIDGRSLRLVGDDGRGLDYRAEDAGA